MLPAFIAFIGENQAALLFYLALIIFIVLIRKKLEWQGIIGLYKTKVGLKLMKRWGEQHRGLVLFLGYIGIGIGFIGMLAIMGLFVKGLVDLILFPDAPPPVTPVIPGFGVAGYGIKVPLITGWLALFVILVIHEFSHGVVSIAHGVKVKSSGLLIAGPIGGAFVEPDEKALKKKDPVASYSMIAAGPWSNILSGAIFWVLWLIFAQLALLFMVPVGGVEVTSVTEGLPADIAGLEAGMVITGVNGVAVADYETLLAELDDVGVGETVVLAVDGTEYTAETVARPDEESDRGYLGVFLNQQGYRAKEGGPIFVAARETAQWIGTFLMWIVMFSFGIGLVNLLPMGPIDGGQLLRTALHQILGSEKRGDFWWKRISLVALLMLGTLLFVPFLRWLL